MKQIMALVLAALMALSIGAMAEGAEGQTIDWSARYTYSELEDQLEAMNAAYPEITSLYPIGNSWQERALWCLEITNPAIAKEDKTGIAVMANIHGGERESAACAMYFAWWLTENSASDEVKAMLDEYDIYVVPVINPDGYEQSFVYNTRQNLRPMDNNGDGVPFSDPYTDVDGDGYIATLYRGTADAQPNPRETPSFGMESPDWDKNGILGDDARNSGPQEQQFQGGIDGNWNGEARGLEAESTGHRNGHQQPDSCQHPEIADELSGRFLQQQPQNHHNQNHNASVKAGGEQTLKEGIHIHSSW